MIEQDKLTKLTIIRLPDLTFEFTHLTVNKFDGSLFYWSLNESGVCFKKITNLEYKQLGPDNSCENDIENLSDCIRQKLVVKKPHTAQV